MEATSVQTCYRHPDQPAGVVCQRCDRPICPRCMHQASVGFHCPECVKTGRQQVYQGIGSLRARPVLTQVLIAINVAVFVLGIALDGADAISGAVTELQVDYGLIAKFAEVVGFTPDGGVESFGFRGVGGGEWYRMLTSGFLHYGLIHVLFNMYALWILGSAVEHMGGRARLAAVYGVSVAAGSLGALVLSPDSLTAGASGGIFGLMGAIFLAQRAAGLPFRQSPLLGILLLNLLLTFSISSISVGGHLGGLAGGALAGWVLFDLGRRPGLPKWAPMALAVAIGVACLVAGVAFAEAWQPR